MAQLNLEMQKTSVKSQKSLFLARTYGWMAFALFFSSLVAYFTSVFMWSETPDGKIILSSFGRMLFGNKGMGFMMLCVLEVVIVVFLSFRISKMSFAAAFFSFVFYSFVNGLTLSSIFTVYNIASIANAFFSTAATFLVMCLYGSKTKNDLTKAGRYLVMALMGILLASVLHFIIGFISKSPLSMLDLIISIATVIVFTGLTAFDSQKILRIAESAKDTEDYKKIAILGALELYLDFINILLSLLKIFGRSKDN